MEILTMVVVTVAFDALYLIERIPDSTFQKRLITVLASSLYFQRPSNCLWKKIAACKVSLSTMKSLVPLSTE